MKQFLKRCIKGTSSAVRRTIGFIARTAVAEGYSGHYEIYSDRWHPHNLLRQEALEDTVAYIKSSMSDAMIMRDELKVLKFAISQTKKEGLFLEFGVRSGNTINFIAQLVPDKTVFGFDSFEGLPENWAGWIQQQGTFGGEGLPKVRGNVHLVKGWFDESLPAFLTEHEQNLAFAHIDSDLYSSAKTVLTELTPRLKPGSVIVFNEYFNYPNWRQHEYRALQEFCAATGYTYEYLCWGKFEVAIRLVEAG